MTRQDTRERDSPMPTTLLHSLRIPLTRLSTLERVCLATCLAVMLAGGAVWWVTAGSDDELQPADPWPVVVRTVDGTPTTMMPEDLDR